MNILGISAFYHDSAAALINDQGIAAAAQEERFSRKKQDSSYPVQSIEFCLKQAGIRFDEIDAIAFYDKPFLKFERLLETYLSFAPRGYRSFGKALPLWIKDKIGQKRFILNQLKTRAPEVDWESKLVFSEHHLSHAASAYYPSPFDRAVVLTLDGVGEWATSSVCLGEGNQLNMLKELHFPHSLGLLYSAFTYYTGFKVNSGEYKVMGLAPYGEPKYVPLIFEHLIDVKADGSFRLNQTYFDYCAGLKMTNSAFDSLFGGPARKPAEPLTQRHMDLAASIQAVTEEVVLRLTRSLSKEFGESNLCLAGGVALNCVANGKILKDSKFKNIWIQPAAGDAGGALGAALIARYLAFGCPRTTSNRDEMLGSYLGPEFSQAEIEQRLTSCGARFKSFDDPSEFLSKCTNALADGKAIGWFQGRMEFGPRALGARSIIADARSPNMQKTLNLKVKFRESFRPFAPAVLREDVEKYFELDYDSPYMLLVANVVKARRQEMTEPEKRLFGIDKLNVRRSDIPAVTHVDYSARIQTVHKDTNPRFYSLLEQFRSKTGSSVVVNTSFNVRGEPIVCSPEDAFRCFMGTQLDILAIGNSILLKDEQDPALKLSYESAFDLD